MLDPSMEDLVARLSVVEGVLRMPSQMLTRDPLGGLQMVAPKVRGRQSTAWTGEGNVGFWSLFKLILRAAGGAQGQKPQDLLRRFGRWLTVRRINPFDTTPRSLLPSIQEFLTVLDTRERAASLGLVRSAALTAVMNANLGTFALLSAAEGFLGMDPGTLVRLRPEKAISIARSNGIEIERNQGASLFATLSRALDSLASKIHGVFSGEDLFAEMVVESTDLSGAKRSRVFYNIGETLRKSSRPWNPKDIMAMAKNSGTQRALDKGKHQKKLVSLDAPLGDGERTLQDMLEDDAGLDKLIQEKPLPKLQEIAREIISKVKNPAMQAALNAWIEGKTNSEIMDEFGDQITIGNLRVSQTRTRDALRQAIAKSPVLREEFQDLLATS